MKTMSEMHGEPDDILGKHEACDKCSACIPCGDCECRGALPGIECGPIDTGPFAGKTLVLSRHAFKRLSTLDDILEED